MQNTQNGLLMCAKYAFPPNLLKLCGSEDNRALFEILNNKDIGEELKNLLLQLENAVPYLRLIAQSNNIKDIFDHRVIEAYWLGNEFLVNVDSKNMFFNIGDRFKKKMKPKDWNWITKNSLKQAKPHHNFHVLEIYRRAGLLKSGSTTPMLKAMNNCCILWGRVIEKIDLDNILVEYQPIEFFEGKLKFKVRDTKKVRSINDSIKVGDEVSLHWDYICDKINLRQKTNLTYWTKFHLNLANQTI